MDRDPTPLRFPAPVPPAAGETLPIAPGILWLRMPLPFALDHINLWLLEDGAGWTVVDTGYALAESKAAWERIFAEKFADPDYYTRAVRSHLASPLASF